MDWARRWKRLAWIWRNEAKFYLSSLEHVLEENANLKRRLAAMHAATTTPLGAFYGSLVGPLDAPTEDLQRAFEITDDT